MKTLGGTIPETGRLIIMMEPDNDIPIIGRVFKDDNSILDVDYDDSILNDSIKGLGELSLLSFHNTIMGSLHYDFNENTRWAYLEEIMGNPGIAIELFGKEIIQWNKYPDIEPPIGGCYGYIHSVDCWVTIQRKSDSKRYVAQAILRTHPTTKEKKWVCTYDSYSFDEDEEIIAWTKHIDNTPYPFEWLKG